MIRQIALSALMLAASVVCAAEKKQNVTERLRLLPLQNVTIADRFWRAKLEVYRRNTIPHSWQYMQNELRALRAAGGEKVDGELNGTWGEANLHKFMEAIAHSLCVFPDAAIERRADDVISLLAKAQEPDGFLHAYITNSGKPKWDPAFLDGSHDGYVLGHMIEAAIEYHAATGKKAFLDIARKAADQTHEHFLGTNFLGVKNAPGFCGHAELEMALVELYRVTGEARYLELARAFIEWRGRGLLKPAGPTPRAYFQDQVPLRQQMTLEGHAVRAIFFATGVADVAIETGDVDYRLASNRFWGSTARRRMAITGSTGPRSEHEAFGEDYELPNNGYYESCAACGLADFAQRVFLLEKRSEPIDVLERVLYNAILHGISLDGTTTYYQNPLSDRDKPRYNSWVCCPPNLSRTLFQIGRYAYAAGPRDVFVNLYVGGSARVPLADGEVQLKVNTEYPWDGTVEIRVESQPQTFAMNLRLPEWCGDARLSLNGKTMTPLPLAESGFIRLDREWKQGDIVKLELPMPVQRIEAHPNIRDCAGRIALQRGPIVYAFEGLDNGGTSQISLAKNARFEVERRPDFLGGVSVIRTTDSQGRQCLAIPFYGLANRAKSTQEVWVKQEGFAPNPAWWEGKLYRQLKAPPAAGNR